MTKQQTKLTLIKRSVPYCGACDVMSTQLTGEGIPFDTIDITDNPEAVEEFGLTSVPALLVSTDGEITDRLVGVHPIDAIKAKLQGGR